jgi:hypothetical protein
MVGESPFARQESPFTMKKSAFIDTIGALSRKWTLRNGLCLAEALTALRLVWVPS